MAGWDSGLLVIFGPPAVGKMTVAQSVAARLSFKVFHNHAILEPLLDVFSYETESFQRLLRRFRLDVIAEAARTGVSLVFTYAWALELAGDRVELEHYVAPYVERGLPVRFVELAADLQTRLERNRSAHRLAEKKSKRDVEWSDGNVRDLDVHQLNSHAGLAAAEPLLTGFPHVLIETADLDAQQVAERVTDWLVTSADDPASGR